MCVCVDMMHTSLLARLRLEGNVLLSPCSSTFPTRFSFASMRASSCIETPEKNSAVSNTVPMYPTSRCLQPPFLTKKLWISAYNKWTKLLLKMMMMFKMMANIKIETSLGCICPCFVKSLLKINFQNSEIVEHAPSGNPT
jgi:hypothetical protein